MFRGWLWWHKPVIPVIERPRQENYKLDVKMSYLGYQDQLYLSSKFWSQNKSTTRAGSVAKW